MPNNGRISAGVMKGLAIVADGSLTGANLGGLSLVADGRLEGLNLGTTDVAAGLDHARRCLLEAVGEIASASAAE